MSSATTLMTSERLTDDVTIVRLMQTPGAWEWDAIIDGLNRYAERCELLVLRGPGWFGDACSRSMTAVTVQAMRVRGIEIAVDDGVLLI